ncbi:MAG: branched-chain amino acid ABC transporter permease, partial [Gammaproteobacteria bacterium]|nr:branched-chain amino acid ABC transporter permease [Gammaproteobacteria bacterium]
MLPLNDIIHLAVTGIAQGCAYGLIALGFVLIYKATEVVNFAHGEFMMLGAFAVLAFSEALGWGFWPAFALGCLSIGVVGYLVDAQIMRRIIGESQASVFILTVAFGFIFRALAGM